MTRVRLVALAFGWSLTAAVVVAGSAQPTGTIALLVVSAVLLGVGLRAPEPVAVTAGIGALVAAYALTLVGRDGVDGRVSIVSGLVVAVVLLASAALDPAPRQAGRVLAGTAVVATTVAATSMLALAVAGIRFTGWLSIIVAMAAGGGGLLLLARTARDGHDVRQPT